MTIETIRARVSRYVALSASLLLAACTPHAASRVDAGAVPVVLSIRFENEGRERVHVYLVGEQREWLLGGVEPGARTTLRVPEASLAGGQGWGRLVVVAGDRLAIRAMSDPRAMPTIQQPVAGLLTREWHVVQGQLLPRVPR